MPPAAALVEPLAFRAYLEAPPTLRGYGERQAGPHPPTGGSIFEETEAQKKHCLLQGPVAGVERIR